MMDDYTKYKQILELWELGKSKIDIERETGIPKHVVRLCLAHFRSVRQLNEAVGKTENAAPIKRRNIIPKFKPRERSYTDDELREAVEKSESIAATLRKLGLRPAGGNYEIIKKRIKEAGIKTIHFRGKGWLKGKKNHHTPKIPLSQILVQESDYRGGSYRLKHRLMNEGYFRHQCQSCNRTEWLEQPIPLELDHINGDRRDNRLKNLRLLCPNCHALTPTYRGKNMIVNGS